MESRNRRRPWLAGAAIGVLFALLIAPATSWVVRTQLSFVVPIRPSLLSMAYLGLRTGVPEATHARAMAITRDYAEHHPNDLPLQIAAALDRRVTFSAPPGGTPPSGAAVLRPLRDRFPNSASLYANILRLATQSEVTGCKRDEEFLLQGDEPAFNRNYRQNPEALDQFDRDAADGERIEPDNAYFPFMRAIGLLSAHRDADALAALDRAAGCRSWNEHYEDEVQGRLRLMDEALGERSALARTAVAYGLLFPQYAAMRGVARVATYKAMELENAGKEDEAYAIRRNLISIGGKMRFHARSFIGTMVGIAIGRHAYMRLDGAPAVKSPQKHTKAEVERAMEVQLDAFCAHLRRIGRGSDEGWARAEFDAAKQIRTTLTPYPDEIDQSRLLVQLGVSWVAGLAALCNAVWMLVLGGICALLVRSRGIRAGRPMSSAARYGSIMGFVVASGAAVQAYVNQVALVIIVVLTLALNAVILVFDTCKGRSGLRRGLAAFWTGVGCTLLAALFCIWHAPVSTPTIDIWAALLGGIEIPIEGVNLGLVGALAWLAWALPIVPFLVALGIGIVSIVCRVPLSVGWVRGFRGLAVPVSCLLCLVYAGIIVRTVRQEAFANYTLQRFVQHEGRFVAEVRGRPWPGETAP